MDITLKNKLVDILAGSNIKREDATFVADILQEIDTRKQEFLLTQKDKVEILSKMSDIKIELIEKINAVSTKIYITIFAVGLIQTLTIIGAILAILNSGK